MFSYYGTKQKIARMYPAPTIYPIIEPFAGAAGYSCEWGLDKDVILYDINDHIVDVWTYLIGATKDDILNLPDVTYGMRVSDLNVPSGAKKLIGFCINCGSSAPKITCTKRCDKSWARYRAKISNLVPRIKLWSIQKLSYYNVPNHYGTWHIDPPYQKAGKYYTGHGKIDFYSLGKWCQSRSGEVMVCENRGADWLPFVDFTRLRGASGNTQVEVIWRNKCQIG